MLLKVTKLKTKLLCLVLPYKSSLVQKYIIQLYMHIQNHKNIQEKIFKTAKSKHQLDLSCSITKQCPLVSCTCYLKPQQGWGFLYFPRQFPCVIEKMLLFLLAGRRKIKQIRNKIVNEFCSNRKMCSLNQQSALVFKILISACWILICCLECRR